MTRRLLVNALVALAAVLATAAVCVWRHPPPLPARVVLTEDYELPGVETPVDLRTLARADLVSLRARLVIRLYDAADGRAGPSLDDPAAGRDIAALAAVQAELSRR